MRYRSLFGVGMSAVVAAVVSFVVAHKWSSDGPTTQPSYTIRGKTEFAHPSVSVSPADEWPRLPVSALLQADPNSLSSIVDHRYWNPASRIVTELELSELKKIIEQSKADLLSIQQYMGLIDMEILDREIAGGRAHARVGNLHLPNPTRAFEFIVRSTGNVNYCVELNRQAFPNAMQVRDLFNSRLLEFHDAIISIVRGSSRKRPSS